MGVTLIVHGGEKTLCFKTKFKTYFGDLKFFCVTFWLYSAPNKREDHFLHIFSKTLERETGDIFFYNQVENLFMRDTVLFVIDFFCYFSFKQKRSFFSTYTPHF